MPVAKFTNRALGLLDRLYNVVGDTSSTDRIDLAPITLVHDLSRMAERASGIGPADGFFSFNIANTHNATGNLFASIAVDSGLISALGGDVSTQRLWVIDVGLQAELVAGNSIGEILVGYTIPNTQGVFNPTQFEIARATAFSALPLQTGSTIHGANTATLSTPRFKLPQLMMPGATLRLASTATVAAGTITATAGFLVWIGARGTRPPTMA